MSGHYCSRAVLFLDFDGPVVRVPVAGDRGDLSLPAADDARGVPTALPRRRLTEGLESDPGRDFVPGCVAPALKRSRSALPGR